MKKKIYLSGPDRLLKNAKEVFEQKRALCEKYGFELLEYPEEVYKIKDTFENSRAVAEKRMELMKECDIVIADTRDFRSYLEPYSEVALEMGMAYALEKKIYSYMPDTRVCCERYSGETHYNEAMAQMVDENDVGFEPGPLNLMLEFSSTIVKGNFEDALKKAAEDLQKGDLN